MSKTITFDLAAKQKLLNGVKILNDAVGSTLGPRGTNVAIDRGYDAIVLHDGVSVARAIELEDPEEQLGLRIAREAANKQVDYVGDGTSVVTILAYSILNECIKIIATGVNPMSLRKGLEESSGLLIKELTELAKPVKTLKEKEQIAIISAEDKELGAMIAKLMDKMGVEGVVTVEESKSNETYTEHQEGMQFEGGYISPYFVTDAGRMESTVEDAYILITDQNVVNIPDLLPLLKQLEERKVNRFVIIAPDVTDSALASLILSKIQGGANVLAVKAPLFGDKQKSFLQDIAILTGGQVITGDAELSLDKVTLDQLGRAKRITSTKDATLIVGGMGHPEDLQGRVDSIRAQIEREEGSDFEIEKLRERIAKLTNGVAIIKVGGHTEVEMKERKERAIDAVQATRAAIEEGIVAGGETIYLIARHILKDNEDTSSQILYRALSKPFYKLLSNAGLEAARFEDRIKDNYGVDVTDGRVKDLIQAGIIDPVKVSKSAIQNAVSVAIQLMSTNVIITEKEVKKNGST